jgi:predicted DNA-binding transcriptional regulator YafY
MHEQPGVPSLDIYDVVERLMCLRNLLCDGPQDTRAILHHLSHFYADDSTGRRKLRRDLQNLTALGYEVEERSRPRPKRWIIVASPHTLSDDDVRALAYIREAFAHQHPLADDVQRFIGKLTTHLNAAQQRLWKQRPAIRIPLMPVADYRDYTDLIHWLEAAIVQRRQVSFHYRARGSDTPVLHPRLDPYEIEFVERQCYLVAFSYRFGAVLRFRINRIVQDQTIPSPALLEDVQQLRRESRPICFTYRLPASFADGGVSERFTIHAVHTDEHHVTIEASDTSEFRIVKILLGYGEHAFLVDGPPSLLNRMRMTVAQMAALYDVERESPH